MIIILNDEGVYLSWLRRHRDGFVVETRLRPTKRNTTLHRASCPEIRFSKTPRTHWTTAGRLKACSLDIEELSDWASQQIGASPNECAQCQPTELAADVAKSSQDHRKHQLTKLERDIVFCVLESAVIHLDNEIAYELTVADVAKYVDRSPAQISPALAKLMENEMVNIEGTIHAGTVISETYRVLPTESALRTVPAFAELNSTELALELAILTEGTTAGK